MRSPSIPNLFAGSSPGNPPDDVHGKLQTEAPQRNKTNIINSVIRMFSGSKALHQVLGIRGPEPLVAPPEIPHNLREKFGAALKDYEQLRAAGTFATKEVEDYHSSRQPQHGKTSLADILEEKESPA